MESGGCNHRWKFKTNKNGSVTRRCRCGLKITEIAVPHGSSLDREVKELWPKGKHRKKKGRHRKNIKRVYPQTQ